MAADLARTICELAAPPVRPAYLLIEAAADDPDACFSVVLYLRPATAGLIITVHHGCEQAGDDEMEETFLQSVKQEGAAYSVPASEAGISAFARLLMDAGAWRRVALDGWWDVLCLSTKAPRTLARHWSRLTLSRYTAEHVAVWPDGENDGFMSMSFAGGGPCIARRVVENDALEYWDGVARLLPDYTERGYFELCDTVMHSAKSALTSLLGLACRYQGVLALLLPAPPAAAAGGQE